MEREQGQERLKGCLGACLFGQSSRKKLWEQSYQHLRDLGLLKVAVWWLSVLRLFLRSVALLTRFDEGAEVSQRARVRLRESCMMDPIFSTIR